MPTSFTESNNLFVQTSIEKFVHWFSRSMSVKRTSVRDSSFIFFKVRNFLFLIISLFLLTGCFENVPDGMVFIPSGEFTIGSNQVDRENHALSLGLDKPWYADESPERRIDIPVSYTHLRAPRDPKTSRMPSSA